MLKNMVRIVDHAVISWLVNTVAEHRPAQKHTPEITKRAPSIIIIVATIKVIVIVIVRS